MAADASFPPRRVLNVGGGSKTIPIPSHYAGWDHVLLDVDAAGAPDVVCDARELTTLPAAHYDAVYCSHNLEHYYRHDAPRVLRGFLHVLKDDGFAEIRVPDLHSVMHRVVRGNLEMNDVLYQSGMGPITVEDVIYGHGREIEQSGRDFYAHKAGFTPRTLGAVLEAAGFGPTFLFASPEDFETRAVAFKTFPTPDHFTLLKLPLPR
ncbi:MAG: methyltransferase domain-containing protein [Betaproteobacteria bacterium]